MSEKLTWQRIFWRATFVYGAIVTLGLIPMAFFVTREWLGFGLTFLLHVYITGDAWRQLLKEQQ